MGCSSSDTLPTIAQPSEPLIVRHDPRDLSRLFVMGKDKRYHTIPYANDTHPPISLGELRHVHALLRSQSKQHIDENMLFATYEKQQQIVAAAVTRLRHRRTTSASMRIGGGP
jgi:putative transposase